MTIETRRKFARYFIVHMIIYVCHYANARCRRHAILSRRDFSRKNYGESSQTIFNKLFSINILQIQKVEFVEVYQFLKNNSNGVAAQTEIGYWNNNNNKIT